MRAALPCLAMAVLLGVDARVCGGERRIGVELGATKVGRYKRLDVTLKVDAVGGNPFDPGDIDLRVEMGTPSGKRLSVPAFHYQAFEREDLKQGKRKVAWLYPVGAPQWRVRFAPMEVGRHACVAKLTDRAGTAQSEAVTFECVPSKSKGFLGVSKEDPRFLAFSEGQPFFAVGQNIAFIKELCEAEDMVARLGAAGGNYARVWTCCEDWGMAIEARKSGWGRSWAWNPPIVHLPGRHGYHTDGKCLKLEGEGASLAFSPTWNLAIRPKTRYVLAGSARTDKETGLIVEVQGAKPAEPITGGKWTPFKRELTTTEQQRWMPRISFRLTGKGTAWLRGLSLKEAAGGPELLAEAAVNRPPRGWYNQLDCFILDQVVEAAERSGVYLQLCLLTRDHYMHALGRANTRAYDEAVADARRLLRYAVARWGCSTHVAAWEYFNEMNPGPPNEVFYDRCGEYLEQTDPYRHLRSTSHWHPSPKYWRHPRLDVADEHYYMRPSTGELFRDTVASVLGRVKHLREAASSKPALLSEFGMTADNWQKTEYMDRDRELVHLHNALWASALSGLSGTTMHWFWEDLHRRDAYPHYRPVSAFVADIPYVAAKLQPAAVQASDPQLRVVALQGKACAYLWLSDAQATWWKVAVDGVKARPVAGATIELEGLEPRRYRVEWWDTWQGKAVREDTARASAQGMRLSVPPFERDIACKVVAQ